MLLGAATMSEVMYCLVNAKRERKTEWKEHHSTETSNSGCSRSCRAGAHAMTANDAVSAVPAAGTHSVVHGVALLDAQEPFLQKSGCNRVRLLASASDTNIQKLLDAGAAAKLAAMLQRTSDDGGFMAQLWLA